MNFYNKHYIRTDDRSVIVYGFSDAFEQPLETDICINEQGGRQFRLTLDSGENAPLKENHGIPLYKWEGNKIVERAKEEIDEDISKLPKPEPSLQDQIKILESALHDTTLSSEVTRTALIFEIAQLKSQIGGVNT